MYTYFSLKAPRCILCFVDHLFVNFVGQSAMFVESTLHTSVSKAMSRSERMSKKPTRSRGNFRVAVRNGDDSLVL